MKDRIRQAFSSLQTRLTLTYTAVTVAALLVLEILILGGLMGIMASYRVNESEYLLKTILELTPRSIDYFERNDFDGMQSWVTKTYDSGQASSTPIDLGEIAASPFAQGHPFVILDPEGTIIALAPFDEQEIGKTYTPPAEVGQEWFIDRVNSNGFGIRLGDDEADPLDLFTPLKDGSWYVVIPVQSISGSKVWGTMVLNILPAPAILTAYLPVFSSLVGITAVILLIGVTPLGAIFGYIMARNITRRLAKLETVADAYSQGDFSVAPEDESQDELGRLGSRLKQMAQQIEGLLDNRQELAALEERNRLARELHDTVKQQNFATIMQVRAAKNLAKKGEDADVALEHLEIAENLLKQSQQDLKGTIEELRPVQLEGYGLPTALRKLTQSWSKHSQMNTNITIQGERPLSLAIEQTLYRVAQEAFANIGRHSDAKKVEVNLRYAPQSITLSICDDGKGFDLDSAQNGFGLSTMHQRMTEANGRLIVDSKPSQGTKITAEVDL